jgi:hypothetical protein
MTISMKYLAVSESENVARNLEREGDDLVGKLVSNLTSGIQNSP